jgi:hypothetical protein
MYIKINTPADYDKEVVKLANEIINERNEQANTDPHELIQEELDNSQLTIYTMYHWPIMEFTQNQDALFDQGIELNITQSTSFHDIIAQFAYWALYTDVINAILTINPLFFD